MDMKKIIYIFFITYILFMSGCVADEITPSALTIPKGNRILGIDVNAPANNDYNYAFAVAKEAGMQVTTLSLNWDDIETVPMQYGNQYLSIANDFYPANATQIALVISPIDTNNLRLPNDLKNKNFDEPEVIDRFNKMMDYVLSQISKLELVCLSIGNEIDIYLGADKDRWRHYERFYEAVSNYARGKRPRLKIGSKATLYGLTKNNRQELISLNRHSDVVLATYYPLNEDFTVKSPDAVKHDFEKIASIYKDKPIYLLEIGYPSGNLCASSEKQQAEFISKTFSAWDKYPSQIRMLNFTWLHDKSRDEVYGFSRYYSITSGKFIEYLFTLGLRTYDGQDKEAFRIFKTQTKERGWR